MKKKKSEFTTKEVIFLVLTTCVLSFAMGMLIYSRKQLKQDSTIVQDDKMLEFIKQYNFIVDNYYDELDKDKLIEGAISGMLDSIGDPYSEYFNLEYAETFNSKLNGNFEGIGIEYAKMLDGNFLILDVFENSDAYKKGIMPGDQIIEINGKTVIDLKTSDLRQEVKEKSEVRIKILRDDKKIDYTLKKGNVTIKSVVYDIVDDYGYIYISIFALNTYDQLKEAIDALEKKNVKGLIIDLRNNSGGHLSSAEKMLSLFIKDSVIYQIENKGKITKYNATGKKDYEKQIVIFVNENSASASELFTSALSEQLGATIIGKNTYGKGTVQELVELSSGVQYKVTTKKWLTSLGKSVQKNGIKPDIEIKNESDYLENAFKVLKEAN